MVLGAVVTVTPVSGTNQCADMLRIAFGRGISPAVLANTSGVVYYVSITGITGSASADTKAVGEAVARIKRHTELPVCVGFGIRTPEAARAIAQRSEEH